VNQNQREKAVIYIGGSKPQIPGIQAAKRAGLFTVVTDKSETAPGAERGDRFARISATDIEQLLTLALQIEQHYQLVGCYGIADYAYEAIGAINEKFELPGGSREVYRRTSNKHIAKKLWRSAGLPVANALVVDVDEEITEIRYEIQEHLTLPAIVKPVDSYNAQGVTLLTTLAGSQLQVAVSRAFQHGRPVMIESYLEGLHVNVDILMLDGKAFPVVCTERWFYDESGIRSFCGLQPSEIVKPMEPDLYDLAARSSRCLGLIYGPITVDVIVTEDGPKLLEISPHFHSLVTTAIRDGGNSIQAWFHYLAGKAIADDDFITNSCAAAYCILIGKQKQISDAFNLVSQEVTIIDRDTRSFAGGDLFYDIVWLKTNEPETLRSALSILQSGIMKTDFI